jgi:hypothetical protein
MLPWVDRRDDLEKYFHQSFNGNEEVLNACEDILVSILPERSISPISYEDSAGFMPPDTNLGLPIFSRDRGAIPLYVDRAYALQSKDDVYPAVVGWRGQPNGTDRPKQRIIWMMDHVETIIGGSIMHPLLDALRVLPGFSAWNTPDDVDVAVTRIMRKAQGRMILSGDYSGFDSSVSRELIAIVFRVIGQWLLSGYEDRLSLLEEVFATTPIITPDGLRDGRDGGVPSGSVLTNLVDSLINLLVAHYIAIRAGCTVDDIEVLGDDFVCLFSDEISPSDIESFANELGMELNADKQVMSETTVHYLQRLYDVEYSLSGIYKGVRSAMRGLSGYTGQERFKKNFNRWRFTAREVSQWENCRYHPCFNSIVGFSCEGDDVLRSGVDIVEIFRLAGGADQVRADTDKQGFSYNTVDPSGVATFKFVEVHRSLF